MNKVNLMGRICKDLEIKKAGETSVLKFNLAVNRRGAKEGQQQADFISCVAFGKTAETMASYLSKGRQIAIDGRIQTGSYEKEGQKIYTTEVIVDSFYFAGSKKDGQALSQEDVRDELPF